MAGALAERWRGGVSGRSVDETKRRRALAHKIKRRGSIEQQVTKIVT